MGLPWASRHRDQEDHARVLHKGLQPSALRRGLPLQLLGLAGRDPRVRAGTLPWLMPPPTNPHTFCLDTPGLIIPAH
jgi:hypothetical protein